MTHLLLLLLSAKTSSVDCTKILNAQQQIIQELQKENAVFKYVLYGPAGTKVKPVLENGKPTCPIPDFKLQYKVTVGDPGVGEFSPYCIREEP
jgi:hypothetical protein